MGTNGPASYNHSSMPRVNALGRVSGADTHLSKREHIARLLLVVLSWKQTDITPPSRCHDSAKVRELIWESHAFKIGADTF